MNYKTFYYRKHRIKICYKTRF